MDSEHTERQSPEARRKSADLSLRRTRPPAQVPGYRIDQFLGSGAYGEVWVGVDQNTSRSVAIKFYTHRGSVDWSLLSREVEKLVYLSADRYVVQLLDVGWDADPPYYVMDYIENGSLNDRIERDGPMSVEQASELFREVAIGLVHAHDKGVLHCDLKPANVLLDGDDKPRLADFGQSRLTHEQTPSLGTLFYMAPEQADLDAVPDAQWDVYALGALFYSAAVGEPPHRNDHSLARIDQADSLTERLACYRHVIRSAPRPAAHRSLAGMDRPLADIIDRCLSPSPSGRFNNVQEVLSALAERDRRKTRQPQLILGLVGPLLILLVMAFFSQRIYNQAVDRSKESATERSRETNKYAAKSVANQAARDIQRFFNAVESVGRDGEFQKQLAEFTSANDELLGKLANPVNNDQALPEREVFVELSKKSLLQTRMDRQLKDTKLSEVASWFVCDPQGTQLAASFRATAANTIGKNYAWRTYFHGGPDDLVSSRNETRVYRLPTGRIAATGLSAPFQSTATNKWKIAISTPIYGDAEQKQFLGVVALTVDLGVFISSIEGDSRLGADAKRSDVTANPSGAEVPLVFAALVDSRDGASKGMILQHPLFNGRDRLPDSFNSHRVTLDDDMGLYRDPLGSEPAGKKFDRLWVIAKAPVELAGQGYATGLTVIVQEDYESVIAPVRDLGDQLMREALVALGVFLLVVVGLWAFVTRVLGESTSRDDRPTNGSRTTTPPARYEESTVAFKPNGDDAPEPTEQEPLN